MTKRYDVCTPRAGKDDKTFWHRVGTAFEGDKGINVVLDSLPLPDKNGRVSMSLFEPRAKTDAAKAPAKPTRPDALDDEEIPF